MTPGPDRTDPHSVLTQLGTHRLIAVVRAASEAETHRVTDSLVEAGVRVIEVTFTTPGAVGVIASLAGSGAPLVVGAGTVCSAEDAQLAVDAGADFLVSAGSPPSVVEAMLSTNLLAVPGVFTPTELMTAQSMGVLAVKLFPASLIGPDGLKVLHGPFPGPPVLPSGGIAIDEVDAWLAAGAHAVGVGAEKILARAGTYEAPAR